MCVCVGLISLSSFRNGDSSYSMWIKRGPCTWSEQTHTTQTQDCKCVKQNPNPAATPTQVDGPGGEGPRHGRPDRKAGLRGPPDSVGLCGLVDEQGTAGGRILCRPVVLQTQQISGQRRHSSRSSCSLRFSFPVFNTLSETPVSVLMAVLSDWLQAGDGLEYKVYLTSFVLIALRKASTIDDPILQLRVRTRLLLLSPPYPAITVAHI